MNFLAHLYLSPDEDEVLLGSLMGDFVKGPLARGAAHGAQLGMLLHRKIDAYTDAHAVVLASRNRISGRRRRYAGIMIDVFYDHFLASQWERYSGGPLDAFAQRVYALLMHNLDRLPGRLREMAPRMAAQDWLTSYRDVDAVHDVLDRMSRRFPRATALHDAGLELVGQYDGLRADFDTFFPELIAFARDTAGRLQREEAG